MILPDHGIENALARGWISVEPVDLATQLQPASLDIRLGYEFVTWRMPWGTPLDVREPPPEGCSAKKTVPEGGQFVIAPGEFVLGTTIERVRLPSNIAGRIEGRSSVGRYGVTVHVTAGFIDPGFDGTITLEIANLNPNPIRLTPGMRIGQLVFHLLAGDARAPYAGKYQGQEGTQPSGGTAR